jgi:hypothetical protein
MDQPGAPQPGVAFTASGCGQMWDGVHDRVTYLVPDWAAPLAPATPFQYRVRVRRTVGGRPGGRAGMASRVPWGPLPGPVVEATPDARDNRGALVAIDEQGVTYRDPKVPSKPDYLQLGDRGAARRPVPAARRPGLAPVRGASLPHCRS